MLYPQVATRKCEDCQKFRYDERTGQKQLDGENQPIPRGRGERLPCHFKPSACAKVAPDAGIELSDRNWLVYLHYLKCRATGRFPDDPIVSENAAIIHETIEQVKEERKWKAIAAMTLSVPAKAPALLQMD